MNPLTQAAQAWREAGRELGRACAAALYRSHSPIAGPPGRVRRARTRVRPRSGEGRGGQQAPRGFAGEDLRQRCCLGRASAREHDYMGVVEPRSRRRAAQRAAAERLTQWLEPRSPYARQATAEAASTRAVASVATANAERAAAQAANTAQMKASNDLANFLQISLTAEALPPTPASSPAPVTIVAARRSPTGQSPPADTSGPGQSHSDGPAGRSWSAHRGRGSRPTRSRPGEAGRHRQRDGQVQAGVVIQPSTATRLKIGSAPPGPAPPERGDHRVGRLCAGSGARAGGRRSVIAAAWRAPSRAI